MQRDEINSQKRVSEMQRVTRKLSEHLAASGLRFVVRKAALREGGEIEESVRSLQALYHERRMQLRSERRKSLREIHELINHEDTPSGYSPKWRTFCRELRAFSRSMIWTRRG